LASLPTTGVIDKPRQLGYDAALDDLLLRLARAPDRPLSITTAPKQTDRLQTEQTSEDFLPEFGDVFSRNNFTGGEGLDFAHRADAQDLDSTRYWDSKGIDISITQPGVLDGITLLVDTEALWASTDSNLFQTRLDDDVLLIAEAAAVWKVALPGAASPGRTSEDPHTGTQAVEGLAALGDEAYAACGTDGIGKRNAAGAWANMASATNCFGIWAAKSRLIADSGAGLIQTIDTSTGAPTTLITMDSGDSINDVIDAGVAILIATSSGTIYALTDESGTLTLQSQTKLTSVDIPLCMAWASGTLIIGTSEGTKGRIYQATVGSSADGYSVSEAQLLKELNYPPTSAVATRDRIYVAARDSATEVVLWRYQLATTSISRDLVFAAATAGDPVSVIRTAERLYVTVAANDINREDTNYIADGWLISPMADFFSPAEKTWLGLKLQAENLGLGVSVDVLVANDPDALLDKDSAAWAFIGKLSSQDQVTEEITLPAIRGRYGAVQLRLIGNANSIPTVISFALRSYSDSEDVIVRMPVNVSDWIERPRRRPLRVPNWGTRVFQALLGFDGSYITLELYRPGVTIRGVVESIDNPIIAKGERGSTTTYSLVQVRGRLVNVGSASSQAANGTLGVGLAGIALAGVDN
jgi:hypothetical protein